MTQGSLEDAVHSVCMRTLFTRFPLESARGGAENQTMWLAAGLRGRGHEVSFLGSCPVLLQTFSASGFPVQKRTIGPPPVTKWHAASFLWRRKEMQRALMQSLESLPHLPDAIIMLSLSEKLLLTEWAHRRGVRVFWIEHDRMGKWLTANPWLPALKKASACATVVCVSELSRRMYIDLGFDPERVIAIPNGVPFPPALGAGEGVREAASTSRLILGCIARLSPEKGIDVLLHAISDIPDIDLTIVGTGPEEAYLRSLIDEDAHRIGSERVTLVSHIVDLEAFYQSLDVLVLPSSDHDPFGLVAAEAMARGIATVVTDVCGIADYLGNGRDALIAKAGSAESLHAVLTYLLDPMLRKKIAYEAFLTAKHHFSLAAMTDAYERVLQKTS